MQADACEKERWNRGNGSANGTAAYMSAGRDDTEQFGNDAASREHERKTNGVLLSYSPSYSGKKSRCGAALDRLFSKRPCQICVIFFLVFALLVTVAFVILVVVLLQSTRDAGMGQYVTSTWTMFPMNETAANGTQVSNVDVSLIPQSKVTPPFRDCSKGQAIGTVQAVFGSLCTEFNADKRCMLKQGSVGTLEVLFTPKVNLTSLTGEKCGSLLMGSLVMPCITDGTTTSNACVDSNLPCPLVANRPYLYRTIDRVRLPPGFLRAVRVNSEISVVDDTKNVLFCVSLPVVIEP